VRTSDWPDGREEETAKLWNRFVQLWIFLEIAPAKPVYAEDIRRFLTYFTGMCVCVVETAVALVLVTPEFVAVGNCALA